jgi:hypothetical protein
VDDRVSIDLHQNRIKIFIQSEKTDQKGFFNPIVKEDISFLPKGEDSIIGLQDVGIKYLGESEKLSTL